MKLKNYLVIAIKVLSALLIASSIYALYDNYNRLADSHIELQKAVIKLQKDNEMLYDYAQYLHLELNGGE